MKVRRKINKLFVFFQKALVVYMVFSLLFPASSSWATFVRDKTIDPLFANINLGRGEEAEANKETLKNKTIPFVENQGQLSDDSVLYYANIFSGSMFVSDEALIYSLFKDSTKDQLIVEEENEKIVLNKRKNNQTSTGIAFEEVFIDDDRQAIENAPSGKDISQTKVSYYKSNNKDEWRSNLASYNYLDLGYVWDDIYVSLKARMNNVEKVFFVEPGADIDDIKILVKGVNYLVIVEDGSLVYDFGDEKVSMTAPVAYQTDDNNKKIDIFVEYKIIDHNIYSFSLGAYDKDRELIIDPLLASTYLEGSGIEDYLGISIAADDSVYVLGQTTSVDIPGILGSYDATHNGADDLIISKFNNDLSQLIASTYLGGSDDETSWVGNIAFDPAGNVFVSTYTASNDYPVTVGAYDETFNGGSSDGVISKLSSDLTTLLASTYIGGSSDDKGAGITIDAAGNIYTVGYTNSDNFPTTVGSAYETFQVGVKNSYIAKLNNDLSTLTESSYMFGVELTSVSLDASDNIFMSGVSIGGLATTTGAYDVTYAGSRDIGVCKFSNDLSQVLAATYLGGSGWEASSEWSTYNVVIDASDNIFVVGETESADFPVTAGAFDETYNGNKDSFITKFNNDLSSVVASTFLGAGYTEEGHAIALDSAGNVFYTAFTDSSNFYDTLPTTKGSYQENEPGEAFDGDTFVGKLSNNLENVLAMTYLGGPQDGREYFSRIAIDSSDNIFIAGITEDTEFPTTLGVPDSVLDSGDAFFISKLDNDLSGPYINHLRVADVDDVFSDGFESAWNDSVWTANAGVDSTVRAAFVQADGKTIIAGSFTSYNSVTRNRIARLNVDGSLDTSFDPGLGANSTIYDIDLQSDGKIIIGGSFTSFDGTAINRIARLDTDGSLDATFNPGTGADSTVYACSVQADDKIIIGGMFDDFNGTAINRIARLDTDGSFDATFDPGTGANNTIYDMELQVDEKIIIGGSFTTINGTARNRISRLDTDGSLDATFDPGTGAASTVYTLDLQADDKAIIGGSFTSFNGTARNRVARLDTDGSLDATFDPGAGVNSTVYACSTQSDGKVVIGGSFTTVNASSSISIARLDTDGSLDSGFDTGTGADSTVYVIVDQVDGKLMVGGYFDVFNESIANFGILRANTDGSLDSFNDAATSTAWEIDSSASYAGASSLHSDGANGNSSAWLSTNYNFTEDGQLSFYWKTTTDVYDSLRFCVDIDAVNCGEYDLGPDSYTARITGDTSWTYVTVQVSAGVHKLMWFHDVNLSTDEAWIDDIKFSSVLGDKNVTVGEPSEISLRAINTNDNISELYSGDKEIIFSGLSSASGVPTCTDKDGLAIAFGASTTLTFLDGLASCDLEAYTVESASIDVVDGTYSSTGSVLYDIDVVVAVAATSTLSATNSSLSVSSSTVTVGTQIDITLTSYDDVGDSYLSGGETVVISVAGSNTDTPSVTDNGDGTYSASYTPSNSGADTITAIIGGTAVGSDEDGSSDGTYNITINAAAVAPANVPINLSGSASINAIDLSWEANSNPAGTEYYAENITVASNSGWTTDLTWSSTGLACSNAYQFRVKARNSALTETAYSSTSTITTNSCGGSWLPPSSPSSPALPNQISIIINKHNGKTKYREVSLDIQGGDDGDTMMISDSPEFCGAEMVPYEEQVDYNLCHNKKKCEAGKKDVYLKIFNKWGISLGIASSDIFYEGDTDAFSLLINQGSLHTKKSFVKLDLQVDSNTDTIEISNYYNFSKSYKTEPRSLDWEMCYEEPFCLSGEKIIYVKNFNKNGELIGNSSRSIYFENTEDGVEVVIEKGLKNTKTERVKISLATNSEVKKVKLSNSPDFCGAEELVIDSEAGETEIDWNLCTDDIACISEQKLVYARFYDEDGEIISNSSDDIYFDNSLDGLEVIVNDDVDTVESQAVHLEITFNEEVEDIAISNSLDFSGSEIVPVSSAAEWDVCNPNETCALGKKIIYVEFYDEEGFLLGMASDEIYYLPESLLDLSEMILPQDCSNKMDTIRSEAKGLLGMSPEDLAAAVYRSRDLKQEEKINNKYIKILDEDMSTIDSFSEINLFITYGTLTTKIHGEGERTGVVNSYKSAFNRLPQTEDEWIDVIRIANGCVPIERNEESEDIARKMFLQAYEREADMSVAADLGAVQVISYGLRPEHRSLEKEEVGISIFQYIFQEVPILARAWDIVRSLVYSGAAR